MLKDAPVVKERSSGADRIYAFPPPAGSGDGAELNLNALARARRELLPRLRRRRRETPRRFADYLTDKSEGRDTMASAQVKPIPDGMHRVTPHLVCDGAAGAIDFYEKAFGAVEEMRLAGPQGRLMHARIRIGDSAIMLVDEFPQWGSFGPKSLKGTPVTIHLFVEDADAAAARAVEAGAKLILPVTDMFWGDRYGVIEDPYGHRWSIATHVRDLSAEEIAQAMPKHMSG
ncbi:Uncharacterized conserved protein PhnB, glyoxalase superfamily [Methylocapsa palsarum]|uniref:Uncharacterized conserved protein PhnB, glyoxalase superfamily n=2 Tax=Methylocapsa palsarum TaxID=1612308 RepID=A0A1I3XZE8_9HYPH|nr:Uncharacterized conserved protein PhnB, glyoxalase superfamily [Methylocapsa palsarum]